MDLVKIAEIAAVECERQQTDFNGYVRLLQAYQFACSYRDARLTSSFVYALATMIEPSKNEYGHYRRTPVTFKHGGHAVDADLIQTAMTQWFDMVNNPGDGLISCGPEYMRETFVKEFLRIHPFKDGNGRVAWILRTYFYDNWESPDPLPKYFPGE